MPRTILSLSRRSFLTGLGLAAGGLALGISPARAAAPSTDPALPARGLRPNAFVHLALDGTVTIVCARSEMGQGVRSSLPALIADELGADLAQIKIVQADGDVAYGNQNTDGSSSVRGSFDDLRLIGATARTMLVAAAAARWHVAPASCVAREHAVHHADGRSLGFAELVARAAALPVPKARQIKLRPRSELTHLGKSLPLVDGPDIVTGRAIYAADVRLPGMLTAIIVRPPVVGGRVKQHDPAPALAVPGVRRVIELKAPKRPFAFQPLGGLAVVADHTWAALRGARKLEVTWHDGDNAAYDSATFRDTLAQAVSTPGKIWRDVGDVDRALAHAARQVDATYHTPHLAHATMEPPAAIARVLPDGRCEIWACTQAPQDARDEVAAALRLPKRKVVVHVTLLGGGFGRKSKPDFIVEAALLARELKAPVRVQWTREDDLRHDYYHATATQRLTAGLDDQDQVVAWRHRTAFPPIGSTFGATSSASANDLQQGVLDLPLAIPNVRVENAPAKAMTRIGWLRSVANIYHAFAAQSFIDELAHARGADPRDLRLTLLGPPRMVSLQELGVRALDNYGQDLDEHPIDTGRFHAVVERVTAAAGWAQRKQAGRSLGLAVHRSFLTYVGVVASAVRRADGRIAIDEAWITMDAGTILNEERVRSQLEGAVIFGLSAALYGAITMKAGATIEDNFRAYRLLRLPDAPRAIHVDIVRSEGPSGGVGEPGVPPVAPAVANAIFALTGTRVRELPIAKHLPL